MKTNAYIFIFTALVYNMIDLGNREWSFIDKRFLDDIWYVLIYSHLTFFFYNSKKAYPKWGIFNVFGFAFWVSVSRLVYNVGILLHITEHTPNKATFFVPCCVLIIAIIDRWKWLLSRLRR